MAPQGAVDASRPRLRATAGPPFRSSLWKTSRPPACSCIEATTDAVSSVDASSITMTWSTQASDNAERTALSTVRALFQTAISTSTQGLFSSIGPDPVDGVLGWKSRRIVRRARPSAPDREVDQHVHRQMKVFRRGFVGNLHIVEVPHQRVLLPDHGIGMEVLRHIGNVDR